jgi:hypothetical protein
MEFEYLVEPKNGIWVAVKSGLERDEKLELVRRLYSSNIIVSDLSGTDTHSPAKKIVFDCLFRPEYFDNKEFRGWCIETLRDLVKFGKDAEFVRWKKFLEILERSSKAFEKLRKRVKTVFTKEYAESHHFPGLKDFYGSFPEAVKVYDTADIRESVEPYGELFSFTEIFSESFDKIGTIERICKRYPERRRLMIKTDHSSENGKILELLNQMVRTGKLDYFTTVYVSTKKMNPNFDFNIGENYKGLVRLREMYFGS